MIVELSPGIASWAYGELALAGGRHNIDTPGPELAAALAAAAAAGVLKVVDGGVPREAVESDEDSLAKQDIALAARAELIAERDRALAAVSRDVLADEPDLPDEDRVERVAAVMHDRQDEWEQRMAAAAQKAVEGAL